jgi:hypothetical protein
MCVPDQDCTTVDCGPGYQCVEQCNALVGPCQVQCVPVDHDPGQCYGSVTCTSPPPLCPASTTPGVANGCYTGYCIPIAACMPNDPGQCYATVTCTAAPPQCPSGTLPGVTNGCYTGFCIPTYDCELAACETLTTEAACTGRGDCEPIYVGTDCTCDPDHCECQTLTYERCQSQVMPL